jgi:hypothetical protein
MLDNNMFLVANWGIPLAAIADMKKDPEYISGKMTTGKNLQWLEDHGCTEANILTPLSCNACPNTPYFIIYYV